MLLALLDGKPGLTSAAAVKRGLIANYEASQKGGGADKAAEPKAPSGRFGVRVETNGEGAPQPAERSHHLQAILDACAHPTSPPTLQQLLSHPYFAPVEGFSKEDVRTAYRRWRKGGLVPSLS